MCPFDSCDVPGTVRHLILPILASKIGYVPQDIDIVIQRREREHMDADVNLWIVRICWKLLPLCCLFMYLQVLSLSLPGDDDEEESGEERLPSCFDYIMHFLTVFWKVLFAFVPPTDYWNGWACFFVSICLIGGLTALTGDLACHFGCTVGLKDSVTAVVFVALGTSVPGGCPALCVFAFKSTPQSWERL